MKKFIIFLLILSCLSIFSQNTPILDNYKFKNLSQILKIDSSSYSLSSGVLFNNNYKISYSILNANYISKINDNLILNYGFGYMNYNFNSNLIFTNFGLTYKKDNLSLTLEVGKTFEK
ncbi:MAG: hypothetical protein QME48_08830 [bacterium]|nr:hypothetical protein [bacterium]